MRALLLTTLLCLMRSSSASVAAIGDSLLAGASTVIPSLSQWSNTVIPNYAIVGSAYHEGPVPTIQAQLTNMTETPTTVIISGGGNDAFSNYKECYVFLPICEKILDETVQMASDLFTTLANRGVQHVLYLGFYYVAGLNRAVDYGTEKLQAACQNATLDCHFVDVRHLNIPLAGDNKHPTDEGYLALALALWEAKTQWNIPF